MEITNTRTFNKANAGEGKHDNIIRVSNKKNANFYVFLGK